MDTTQLDRIGLAYFALNDNKRPMHAWGALNSRLPTEEERRVARMSKAVALVTGAINGIVVIDCESLKAGQWCIENLAPTPLQVLTRRGVHLYYRPANGRSSQRMPCRRPAQRHRAADREAESRPVRRRAGRRVGCARRRRLRGRAPVAS